MKGFFAVMLINMDPFFMGAVKPFAQRGHVIHEFLKLFISPDLFNQSQRRQPPAEELDCNYCSHRHCV